MFKRTLDLPKLLKIRSFFLFGARGTGKSTLIDQTLGGAKLYDLLDPNVFQRLLRKKRERSPALPINRKKRERSRTAAPPALPINSRKGRWRCIPTAWRLKPGRAAVTSLPGRLEEKNKNCFVDIV